MLYLYPRRSPYCSLKFPKRLPIILITLTDLSPAISTLIMFSTVIIHLAHSLFIGTLCHMDDTYLASGMSQQHETRSGTHFRSTNFLVFSTSLFSWNFCRGSTTTSIESWSTLIPRPLPALSELSCTSLFNGTVIGYVNARTDLSSSSPIPYFQFVLEYNIPV